MVPSENQARLCALDLRPNPPLFARRVEKGLLACNSSFRRSSNCLLPLALSDEDRLGRQRVHSEARQSYFSVYLRPPALELCDFYSGSVVPKLDLVWRRIFIASGCEAVATPPCRAPHCLQRRPDEVPPGPLGRLIPSPLPLPPPHGLACLGRCRRPCTSSHRRRVCSSLLPMYSSTSSRLAQPWPRWQADGGTGGALNSWLPTTHGRQNPTRPGPRQCRLSQGELFKLETHPIQHCLMLF